MVIDVHGHISPPEAMRRYPMPAALGDVEGMIDAKLNLGIRLTIVGSPVGAGAMVPLPGVDNYAQSDSRLRALHDWFAEMVGRYPDNLRSYVYVNPFGGAAHLAHAAETARESEFVGFVANTSIRGRYLSDPEAGDFFAMATELDLPVLLHAPAAPAAGTGLDDLMLLEQLGRFCDVTIGVAVCLSAGWLDRYPTLKLIATSCGGALGLLAEKLDLAWSTPHWGKDSIRSPGRNTEHRPSSYLRRIWVDSATPSRSALELAFQQFGHDRLMFGTDSPPLPVTSVAAQLRTFDDLPHDRLTKIAVLEENARRLFGDRLPPAVDPTSVRAESTS